MKNFFDEHSESYSSSINASLETFGSNHEFFFRHKAQLINELLQQAGIATKESKLLDFGCGVGLLHNFVRDQFLTIDGIDTSEKSIRVAQKQHPQNNYVCYDGAIIPYADNAFDVSIAVAVFHHIPPSQWRSAANELRRVTRHGGSCIIIEHNPYNPVSRYIVNTCELDKEAVLLSPRKLRSLFSGAGPMKSRTVLSVPPINGTMSKLDKFLGLLPFGAQHYLSVSVHKESNTDQSRLS